jgi:SAM-dependent methyltransferase
LKNELKMLQTKKDLLHKFVRLNWLRPENAIFNVGRSWPLQNLSFDGPSLDVGCGDGIFSFAAAGGEFSPAFDRFQFMTKNILKSKNDIHDSFEQGHYNLPITSRPKRKFDCGTDFNVNMIAKASALGFHEVLTKHDSNKPFPYEAESYATIYCNTAYWIDNAEGLLKEFGRILKTGGKLYLQVLTNTIFDHFFESVLEPDADWFHLVDGGRRESYKNFKSADTWRRSIEIAGLRVVEEIPTLHKVQAGIWNIGLRPIARQLIEMANLLNGEDRARIKAEFCANMEVLLEPLIDMEPDFVDSPDVLFVLESK